MHKGDLHRQVTSHPEAGIRETVSQMQKFLGDLACCRQLCPQGMECPQSQKFLRNLGCVTKLLRGFRGSEVHNAYPRASLSLRSNNWAACFEWQKGFLPSAPASFGQPSGHPRSATRGTNRL